MDHPTKTTTIASIRATLEKIKTLAAERAARGEQPLTVLVLPDCGRGPDEEEDSECRERGIKPRKTVFAETYRWDKARNRYAPIGKGFEALVRLNEKHL